MHAESAGRNTAANPRSTALGPFQFIKSTFIAVMRRHFPADVAHLSETDILALRTDRGFARRAAEAFSRDIMDFLADKGLKPTFGHLRLAFLLGPSAAAKVLQAAPHKPVARILDGSVIVANPFMRRMTAADLVARATRDVSPRQPARAQQAAPTEAAPAAPVLTEDQSARVADAGAAPSEQAAPAAATAETVPAAPVQTEEQPARVADAGAAPSEQAATADAAPRSSPPTPAARTHRGTMRHGGRVAVIKVTCNPKLASCQRWINQQVAKLTRTKVASRDGRRGA
jgi:hypothetical protein